VIALKQILVATDFSQPSDAALRYGRDLARTYHASLHVLHVTDDLAARMALAPLAVTPNIGNLQADLEADARRSLEGLLPESERTSLNAQLVTKISDHPAETIVSYAREKRIDLIIIGTHGRSGMAHLFMGSVAERVVRTAPCPVLTVRHPEREFVLPDALQTVTAAR
jgi:nucleotide-binding universal stress UspA family protein